MSKRRIQKLKSIIPEITEEIAEGIIGTDSWGKTITDITEDVVESVFDKSAKKKKKRNRKRLISIKDIDQYKQLMRLKEKNIDTKFASSLKDWLVYDYVNSCFRLQTTISKSSVWLNIGEYIKIYHSENSDFVIKTELAKIFYRITNDKYEIIDYEIIDKKKEID